MWVACDPPKDTPPKDTPKDNVDTPRDFAFAGDYIITNSTQAEVQYPQFFQAGTYAPGSVYLGTLHVGSDASLSIASIEADFQTSGALHRIDFETAEQDPNKSPPSIAETSYNMDVLQLNSSPQKTNIIPVSYERDQHAVSLQFVNPTGGAVIEINIPAGASATDPWRSGTTSALGPTLALENFSITLMRKQ